MPITVVGENFREVPEVELSDAAFEQLPSNNGKLAIDSDMSKMAGIRSEREHSKSLIGSTLSIRKLECAEKRRNPRKPALIEVEDMDADSPHALLNKVHPQLDAHLPVEALNDTGVLLVSSDSNDISTLKDSSYLDSEMNVETNTNIQEEEYIRMSLLSFQILHKDNDRIMALDPTALFKELKQLDIPFYQWNAWIADLVLRLQLESAYQYQAEREVLRRH